MITDQYHDICLRNVPFSGCKTDTAIRLAEEMNNILCRLKGRHTIQYIDMPAHSRTDHFVTSIHAFISLADPTANEEFSERLRPVAKLSDNTVLQISLSEHPRIIRKSRAYVWHRDVRPACICIVCHPRTDDEFPEAEPIPKIIRKVIVFNEEEPLQIHVEQDSEDTLEEEVAEERPATPSNELATRLEFADLELFDTLTSQVSTELRGRRKVLKRIREEDDEHDCQVKQLQKALGETEDQCHKLQQDNIDLRTQNLSLRLENSRMRKEREKRFQS